MESVNNLDTQYTNLLLDILDNGVTKQDRTGTGTLSVFGRQIRHKMSEGFPLLTTKKMPFRLIATELLWFLRGDTNIKFLVDNGCHIWDGDAYKNYESNWLKENPPFAGPYTEPCLTQEEFIEKIKTDDEFAKTWGELGPIYGHQWRNLNSTKSKQRFFDKPIPYDRFVDNRDGIDQIANLIRDLKTNPDSRRLMVSAWNVGELDQMVLPPCHYGFQVYTRELSSVERFEKWWVEYFNTPVDYIHSTYAMDIWETEHSKSYPTRSISLMWNQRSVDTFLGLPFNIASYGLLLEIIANETNMVPDELIGNLGDTHLYLNHIEQAKEQIGRKLDLEERRAMVTQEMFNQIYNAGDSSTLTHSEIDQWDIPRIKTREPYPLPTLVINDEFWNSDADLLSNLPHIQVSDFYVDNYQSHPTIKAPLSN
jgi:thymidylate synthase